MNHRGIPQAFGSGRRRRALVAVQVAVVMGALVGFAALTVDVGTLFRARAELQSAADAGALAAATALATDSMMQVRYGQGSLTPVRTSAMSRADFIAMLNRTLNDPTRVDTGDIAMGRINLNSATESLDTSVSADDVNAVWVYVARDVAGVNGGVELFFGPIFGKLIAESSASAVAAFDDRFESFDTHEGGGRLLPFTVHEDVYNADLVGGSDDYAYDPDFGSVTYQPDGTREVNIYPETYGAGGFGLLNIGTPNQGVPALRDHIQYGVPAEDFESETGSAILDFFDEDGNALSVTITGDPGMKVALESAVETRVGQIIGFFLHSGSTGTGSNLTYTITTMRFGRVMAVQLTGTPDSQGIWVQPVPYTGAGVRLGTSAPSSGGQVGRILLVR